MRTLVVCSPKSLEACIYEHPDGVVISPPFMQALSDLIAETTIVVGVLSLEGVSLKSFKRIELYGNPLNGSRIVWRFKAQHACNKQTIAQVADYTWIVKEPNELS